MKFHSYIKKNQENFSNPIEIQNLPNTYGLAKMAGTVKPTTMRKIIQDVKFHVIELNAHAIISKKRYTKNDGRRPQ